MMKPLQMKKMMTPHSPGRNVSVEKRSASGHSRSAKWVTTTIIAAMPRSASRNSSRPWLVATPGAGATVGRALTATGVSVGL